MFARIFIGTYVVERQWQIQRDELNSIANSDVLALETTTLMYIAL